MNKKQIKSLLDHDDGYLVRFVEIPSSKGYFIEAVSRLDGMLDEKIIQIASLTLNDSRYIILKLKKENAIIPMRLAVLLKKENIFDKKLLDKIERFKECRNKLVHVVHGEHDLALKESGFFEKEGVCYNCIGCIQEHLNSLGAKNLDDYAQKVLKDKINNGIVLFRELQNILKKSNE
jgi:uncharacterized protein YutE (UPF0331/DUF86 family)